jgi:MauM/NapG family ferredoxin protein
MGAGDEPSAERRHLIRAGLSGLGAGIVTLTGLRSLHGDPGPGQVAAPHLIRPPGAVPEKDFLARCIRCGTCMKACPSNTLQPIGFQIGLSGFFSPGLTPRRGACLAQCNLCGQVCPTGAIRPLALEEKIWAKVGTAYVLRHKCLTWEFGRRCLVCDEVCPYNAVEFKNVPGIPVAVPFVNENRCSGCGFCELHCPVQAQAAIVVEPMGALRLPDGSFRDHGQRAGLTLELRAPGTAVQEPGYGTAPAPLPADATPGETAPLPPGFTR